VRGTAVICFSQHAQSASHSGIVTHQVLTTETKFVSGKQPQQNTQGRRTKATGTNTVHLQTNDPSYALGWRELSYHHKSHLSTKVDPKSHFTILCNDKTYAQAGNTSVMLKGRSYEIRSTVLSDQTREWL